MTVHRPALNRRRFPLTSLAGAIATPLAAEAQATGKVHRIGFLSGGSQPPSENRQAFEGALHELGWVSGQNLAIAYSFAEGKYDRLLALAADLVRFEPRQRVSLALLSLLCLLVASFVVWRREHRRADSAEAKPNEPRRIIA